MVEVHAGDQLLTGIGQAADERLDRRASVHAQAARRDDGDEAVQLLRDRPFGSPHLGDWYAEPSGDDDATLLLRAVGELAREDRALLLRQRRGELQQGATLNRPNRMGCRVVIRRGDARPRRRRRVASRRAPWRRDPRAHA